MKPDEGFICCVEVTDESLLTARSGAGLSLEVVVDEVVLTLHLQAGST